MGVSFHSPAERLQGPARPLLRPGGRLRGDPFCRKNHKEIEPLIGFFIQTLALRTDLTGSPSFDEVVRRVRDALLEAQANQDIPFERIVEELAPQRSLATTPIFQIFFNHIKTQLKSRGAIAGIEVEVFTPHQGELDSKFDLTFYVRELEESVELAAVYNPRLFSRPRMTVFLEQYRGLLEQIVAGAEQPIDAYSLVTPEIGRHPSRSAGRPGRPASDLADEDVRVRAARTPDRPALIEGPNPDLPRAVRTFAGLGQASAISGGGPGRRRGRGLPRSFGLIVGMLAVLFNGSVLLPIDVNLPAQRRRLMIREAGARFVLRLKRERRGGRTARGSSGSGPALPGNRPAGFCRIPR